MTEILIVIAIIVLFITLALPAFNLISGGRSIAGGVNLVSAFLGQARMQAIGLQQTLGVGFYVDAATGKSTMCLVQQPLQSPNSPTTIVPNATAQIPAGTYGIYGGRYYVAVQNLPVSPSTTIPMPPTGAAPADDANWSEVDQYATDAASNTDFIPLPAGVGAQLINDNVVNTSTGTVSSNHYVSFGAILFDGTGTMVSRRISLPHEGALGQKAFGPPTGAVALNTGKNLPYYTATPANDARVYSQVGAVLFDLSTYAGAGGMMTPQSIFNSPPGFNESTQENWLDHNATPLLINRYNGTLIRSE